MITPPNNTNTDNGCMDQKDYMDKSFAPATSMASTCHDGHNNFDNNNNEQNDDDGSSAPYFIVSSGSANASNTTRSPQQPKSKIYVRNLKRLNRQTDDRAPPTLPPLTIVTTTTTTSTAVAATIIEPNAAPTVNPNNNNNKNTNENVHNENNMNNNENENNDENLGKKKSDHGGEVTAAAEGGFSPKEPVMEVPLTPLSPISPKTLLSPTASAKLRKVKSMLANQHLNQHNQHNQQLPTTSPTSPHTVRLAEKLSATNSSGASTTTVAYDSDSSTIQGITGVGIPEHLRRSIAPTNDQQTTPVDDPTDDCGTASSTTRSPRSPTTLSLSLPPAFNRSTLKLDLDVVQKYSYSTTPQNQGISRSESFTNRLSTRLSVVAATPRVIKETLPGFGIEDVEQDLPIGQSLRKFFFPEIWYLFKSCYAIIITNICLSSQESIEFAFAGQLGETELAAAALAQAYFNCCVYLLIGLVSGQTTLVSQAEGLKNFAHVRRTVLKRSFLLITLFAIPLLALLNVGGYVLLMLKEEAIVIDYTATYLHYYSIALLAQAYNSILADYMVAQSFFVLPMLVHILGVAIDVISNLVLTRGLYRKKTKLGFIGAPISAAITRWSCFVLLCGCVLFVEWYKTRADRRKKQEEIEEAKRKVQDEKFTFEQLQFQIWKADEMANIDGSDCDTSDVGDDVAGVASGASDVHRSPMVSPITVPTPGDNNRNPMGASANKQEETTKQKEDQADADEACDDMTCCHKVTQFFEQNVLEVLHPRGIWEYLKVGIPGTMMLAAETWNLEIVTIIAGFLQDPLYLSAHSVVVSVIVWVYTVPFSISVATSVRVGYCIGKNKPNKAKVAAFIGVGVSLLFMLLALAVSASLRWYLPRIFTSSHAVLEITALLLPIASAIQILDGFQCCVASVIQGMGNQYVGAVANILGYYCIGFPIGVMLAFATPIHIYGLWAGIGAGLLFVSLVVSGYVVVFSGFRREVSRAKQRVNRSDTRITVMNRQKRSNAVVHFSAFSPDNKTPM